MRLHLATIMSLTSLLIDCFFSQAKQATSGGHTWGIDGNTGNIVDMNELGVWDPLSVKEQTLKTAIEVKERRRRRRRRGEEEGRDKRNMKV